VLKLTEREWKREGELYVVARTAPGGGYNGFAVLPIEGLKCTERQLEHFLFQGSHKSSLVTWFGADKRREVLGMFAASPKLYYRCVIVDVKELG
jgi:hypothetical protein